VLADQLAEHVVGERSEQDLSDSGAVKLEFRPDRRDAADDALGQHLSEIDGSVPLKDSERRRLASLFRQLLEVRKDNAFEVELALSSLPEMDQPPSQPIPPSLAILLNRIVQLHCVEKPDQRTLRKTGSLGQSREINVTLCLRQSMKNRERLVDNTDNLAVASALV